MKNSVGLEGTKGNIEEGTGQKVLIKESLGSCCGRCLREPCEDNVELSRPGSPMTPESLLVGGDESWM